MNQICNPERSEGRDEGHAEGGKIPSHANFCKKEKKMLLKIILIAIAVIIAIFLLLFVIYFFNLDMKLIVNVIAPILEKYHDKKDHDQYV